MDRIIHLYLVTKKDKEKQPVLANSDNHENAVETEQKDTVETLSFYSKYGGDIFSLISISLFALCIYNTTSRTIIFSILMLLSLFIVSFSLRQKLFTTTTMKINLAKDIVMMVALIVGLINKSTGLYVSIICLGLYSLDYIRNFTVTHVVGKK